MSSDTEDNDYLVKFWTNLHAQKGRKEDRNGINKRKSDVNLFFPILFLFIYCSNFLLKLS